MFEIRDNCFVFQIADKNGKINHLDPAYLALRQLLDEGFAKLNNDVEVKVPFDNIYALDELDYSLLGLPKIYPYIVYISFNGIFPTKMKYRISYRTFEGGDVLPEIRRLGPVVTLKVGNTEIEYLLTHDRFVLVNALEEYNKLPQSEKTQSTSLKRFAQIKELSEKSASILDKTLNSRNVIVPKKVVLDFSRNTDGSLSVAPNFGTDVEEDLLTKFDKNSSIKDLYTAVNKKMEKSLVVLDERQQAELTKVKQYRKVYDPKQIKALVEHPEEVFDPEVLSLGDLYSERVIGIGLYAPKIYPFVSPYKSQWIPSFEVEDRTNGTTKIFIKDLADLEELREAVVRAENLGKNYCEFKGANIGLDDAKQMFEKSRIQLDKKETVTESGENSIEEKAKTHKVLLIEDNMDKLGYKVDSDHLVLPESLKLKVNLNLAPEFTLKRHQEEGIAWLQDLCMNAAGGLLADDMGLGKTLQVLYLLDWHAQFHNSDNKPYLIVAPVSLLENWSREYKRFFINAMPVAILDKLPTNRDDLFIKKYSYKHIMIIGYETMRRAQISLGAINFAIVVLDEAQKIKTPSTMVTNAAKALKADFRIAMTGTPVENSYMDFWCIMDFSIPGLLGNAKSFSQKFQAPLKKINTNVDEIGRELRKKVGGYFLRRLKTELSDELPEKKEEWHYIDMPSVQLEQYINVINMGLDARKNEKTPAPLQRIQELRRVCDHPYLGMKNVEEISVDELIKSSAKLIATIHIVNDIKTKNEKVIVFTERRDMQRMLQRVFFAKYKIEVSVINGETGTRSKGNNVSRQATVDRFQEKQGFNIIIMSQLAAGVGLNVTGANHVIHYSRHWNPAKEMQATDRVYRIGQKKDVFIHYPMAVTSGFATFDVILNDLLARKTSLATASLYPTEQIEITPAELDEKLFGCAISNGGNKLAIKDVHLMNEFLFEAFAAVFYEKLGFTAMVTARMGDKGVDVLAEKGNECYAIQCKRSKNLIGPETVNEVVAGIKYYKNKYKKVYIPVVFTDSTLTLTAQDFANANKVKIITGKEIEAFLVNKPVLWKDIMLKDADRIS